MKLISVIMGIKYTRAETDTLRRSIDSILNQTYENIEFLICEKGSSEDAKALLREYEDKSDKIKLIDGSGAKSFSEQLNMCLSVASGELIARMDDDDYSLPDRFQKQADFLEENEDFAFVGSNVSLFWQGEIFDHDSFPEKPEVLNFVYVMPFVHPSIMFRKEIFDKVGFYGEQTRCNRCEDYDLLLRIYENGMKGYNIQEELLIYTFPKSRVTTRTFKDRWRETRTRFVRFKALHLLPKYVIYALKPTLTFFIPKKILSRIKNRKKKKLNDDK